jgi:hypothetical protein
MRKQKLLGTSLFQEQKSECSEARLPWTTKNEFAVYWLPSPPRRYTGQVARCNRLPAGNSLPAGN